MQSLVTAQNTDKNVLTADTSHAATELSKVCGYYYYRPTSVHKDLLPPWIRRRLFCPVTGTIRYSKGKLINMWVAEINDLTDALNFDINVINEDGNTCVMLMYSTISGDIKYRADNYLVSQGNSCVLCEYLCDSDTFLTDCIVKLCRLSQPHMDTIYGTLKFIASNPTVMKCGKKCGEKILQQTINHPQMPNFYEKLDPLFDKQGENCFEISIENREKSCFPFLYWMLEDCKLKWNINSPVYTRQKNHKTLLMKILRKKYWFNSERENYKDFVNALLMHPELDINVQDERGWTAAYYAVMTLNPEVAKLVLMHKDCDITIENSYGSTVYKTFSEFKSEEVTSSKRKFDDYMSIKSLIEKKINESGQRFRKVTQAVNIGIKPEKKDILEGFKTIKDMIEHSDYEDKDFFKQQVDVLISELELPTMRPKMSNNSGSMTEEHRKSILANYSFLCEEMEPRDLYDLFIEKGIFTIDHKDYIDNYGKTRRERCQIFIGILLRTNDMSFTTLCHALTKCGQDYVAQTLESPHENNNPDSQRNVLIPAIGFPPIWIHPSFADGPGVGQATSIRSIRAPLVGDATVLDLD